MKYRQAKLIVNSSGGTASKCGKTYRTTLPSSWINELGLGEDVRDIELSFDGERIILSPALDFDAYIKSVSNHQLIILDYYNFDRLQTTIAADYTEKKVRIKNHTDDTVHLAFGVNKNPSWEDYTDFLEERCIPRTRAGINDFLDTIGVDEYEPLEIIRITEGRMAEDHQWIRVRNYDSKAYN